MTPAIVCNNFFRGSYNDTSRYSSVDNFVVKSTSFSLEFDVCYIWLNIKNCCFVTGILDGTGRAATSTDPDCEGAWYPIDKQSKHFWVLSDIGYLSETYLKLKSREISFVYIISFNNSIVLKV